MVFKLAIVGSTSDKFDEHSKQVAQNLIKTIINKCVTAHSNVIVVSGASPKGGIDVWAETIAKENNLQTEIHAPQVNCWDNVGNKIGYKSRNMRIAQACDEIHVIVPEKHPSNYVGSKHVYCYHCERHGHTSNHIKSAGCWTAWEAHDIGKNAYIHVIKDRAASAVNEVI